MAGDRAAYMGPRLRRLRRDLGLTQLGMAADLAVSVSYVSLLESNQRPLTADMLLRLARTYRIDMADFAGDGGEQSAARLQTVLRDPLFADIDLPALQAADVATNFPGIAEAFLRLHTAYREEQRALAERGAAGGEEGDALIEVRRFLAANRNSFPALDDAAEGIASALTGHDGMPAYLAARHRLRVRVLPSHVMAGMIRRHDPHNRAIYLDAALDRDSRDFQLALQIAYLDLRALLEEALEGTAFSSDNGRRLARRALANYAAAAILMPYERFAKAAEDSAYDIQALARQFATSFEQTAHRLTTLQRAGQDHVPFFFLRVDAAGNVSKQLDGAGFPFAGHGGGCVLWSVHDVFRTQGELVTQWVELPDGQRFFSIARLVTSGGGGYLAPRLHRAVALGCAAGDAHRLIYTRGLPAPTTESFTPIGITCALCQRDQCAARAIPPIGRQILADDYHRRRAPFGFADDIG